MVRKRATAQPTATSKRVHGAIRSPSPASASATAVVARARAGGIGAMILNYDLYKVWDLVAVCNGCLAGLVSMRRGLGQGVLQPWSAILAVSSAPSSLWASSKLRLKRTASTIPPRAFPHGACGAGASSPWASSPTSNSSVTTWATPRLTRSTARFLGGGGKLLGNQILGIVVITLWVGATIGGLALRPQDRRHAPRAPRRRTRTGLERAAAAPHTTWRPTKV